MCDICNNESGGKDVGVAAVPGAPVSLMWCDSCLEHNATARFVVETWLFSEFDGERKMPEHPSEYKFGNQPLAEWAASQTLWMGTDRGYVTVRELYPELWRDEYRRRLAELGQER